MMRLIIISMFLTIKRRLIYQGSLCHVHCRWAPRVAFWAGAKINGSGYPPAWSEWRHLSLAYCLRCLPANLCPTRINFCYAPSFFSKKFRAWYQTSLDGIKEFFPRHFRKHSHPHGCRKITHTQKLQGIRCEQFCLPNNWWNALQPGL